MIWRKRTAWPWSEQHFWRKGWEENGKANRENSSWKQSMSRRKRRLGNSQLSCQSKSLNSSPLFWTLIYVFLHRLKAEEERLKKEEEKARREFIKQEYLRRKQLKLMEDMDTLVKPRPTGAKQRKPRPKSIHRDVMESPRTPIRATAGRGWLPTGIAQYCMLCATLSLSFSSSLHPSAFPSNFTCSKYLFYSNQFTHCLTNLTKQLN